MIDSDFENIVDLLEKREDLKGTLWRYQIATFAEHVSQGRWTAYPWLKYLLTEIQVAVTQPGARIVVTAPPRHGKSEALSHYLPLWYLDWNTDKRVILASYSDALAVQFSLKVRQDFQIHADKLKAKVSAERYLVDDWHTTDHGGMRATGIGGSLTGMGGHLLIVDDPHKDWSEANSPTIRKKVVDWFNSVLSLRAEPGASIVVVQTRWHEDDLAGYLLREHKDRWREIRLPALSEGDGDLLSRPEGQALCPERYDEIQIERVKQSVGSFMFAGLYQQRPAPLEGGMVKRDSFRRWSTLPEHFSTVIQSWDLTFKATGSSYIVGQVWGAAPHSNGTVYKSHYYLIDQIREKLSFMDTIKRIYELSERHESAVVKLIEDKANGPAIMSALKDQVPGIVAYSPRGSKEARLAAVSGLIEAGNVFIPEKSIASWSDDFVEEVATFPHGRNDDQVDAMTMALDHLIHKRAEYRTDFSISEAGFRANPWRM